MRPHPRIRKTIKWGGAVLTVLLVVVWTVSGWWYIRWSKGIDGPCVQVSRGVVVWIHWAPWEAWSARLPLATGWESGTNPWAPKPFSFAPTYSFGRTSLIVVPLWMIALITGSISALAFRLDTLARRRARLNLCRNCTYDRTGLPPDTVCPECGMPGTTPGRASESQ